MTLKEALVQGTAILKDGNNEAPALEAGVLLCLAAGCDRAFLYAHGERELTNTENSSFFDMLEKRIGGIPLQHLTGHQEFMSLDFIVNSAVLIPRQDTEILVEAVISFTRQNYPAVADHRTGPGEQVRVLDMGTGSGCIAVSLAYYLNSCSITALDISMEALKVAQKNARNNRVENRVELIHSNLFEALGKKDPGKALFDIIVSNPPYIPTIDIEGLQTEVKKHEPMSALDGGQDGLNFYRAIVSGSPEFLKTEGLLAFEVGIGQAEAVAGLMQERYQNIHIIKDLSGIDRVVTGIRKR